MVQIFFAIFKEEWRRSNFSIRCLSHLQHLIKKAKYRGFYQFIFICALVFAPYSLFLAQDILKDAHNPYRPKSQTPDLRPKPVAGVFCMMRVLCFNIFAYDLPSIPNASMEQLGARRCSRYSLKIPKTYPPQAPQNPSRYPEVPE